MVTCTYTSEFTYMHRITIPAGRKLINAQDAIPVSYFCTNHMVEGVYRKSFGTPLTIAEINKKIVVYRSS